MSCFLSIDPGTSESAWMLYDGRRLIAWAKEGNGIVLAHIRSLARFCDDREEPWRSNPPQVFAIETIRRYEKNVGAEVFEACYWTGRFVEAWENIDGVRFATRLTRNEVRQYVCGTQQAGDAQVRQALIDRFGGVQGRKVAIGTKKAPGPLYGLTADGWQALAVAVTAAAEMTRRSGTIASVLDDE